MDPIVEELFQRALDLPEAQRLDFVIESCAHNPPLQREVEVLLAHYAQAPPRFLEPSFAMPESAACTGEPFGAVGASIGRYRILRTVGEGGMGVVYEAMQDHPRRTVALKVMRAGLTNATMRRRFEYEADILGRLRHPGIAQIYEAATLSDHAGGQPYIVMEYLRGRSLLDYARHHDLSVSELVALMILICDAVHFAHSKGIVHRDLKPANIIVEEVEGQTLGQPKLVDFGIARLMQSDATLQTLPGQLLGSLWYMSPEQISGDSHELDTAADVYALGVVLFELLAGRLPYDLRGRSLPEVGRIIREQEPLRLGELNQDCRGDLETIVAKALEKDKVRRYGSAAEFANDLRRYLHDEPVLARPASRLYQFRKFTRRNRSLVAAAVAVFAALILGIIGTGEALVRARRAESAAAQRLVDARREAAKSAAVSQFLKDMLSAAAPANSRGHVVTVREVLDGAVYQLESGTLRDQPDVEAEICATLGAALYALGHYPEAEKQFRKAVDMKSKTAGANSPELAANMRDLAQTILNMGDLTAAEAIYRQALTIDLAAYGESHAEVAQSLHDLAAVLRAQARIDEAEPLYRQALALREKIFGPDSLEAAQTINSLALLAQNREDYAAAESLFRRSLAIRRQLLGEDHPDVAGSLNNLGNLLRYTEKKDEAERLLREALAMRRKIFGDEHPEVAQGLNNLGVFLLGLSRFDEAEGLFREAIPLYKHLIGEMHQDTARPIQGLALALHEQGSFAESEALYRESLSIRRSALGDDHLDTAISLAGLASLLVDMGRFDEAEPLARDALRIRQSNLPPNHWHIALTQCTLGAALTGEGRIEEARSLFDLACRGLSQVPAHAALRKLEALRRIRQFLDGAGVSALSADCMALLAS